jgi:hypothetical protein
MLLLVEILCLSLGGSQALLGFSSSKIATHTDFPLLSFVSLPLTRGPQHKLCVSLRTLYSLLFVQGRKAGGAGLRMSRDTDIF